MATKWTSPTWRMPEESNQSKFENYSLDFDGAGEKIDLGDSDIFSFGDGSTDSPFSFFIWAKFGNITTNCFISKQTSDTSNSEYQFWQSGDSFGITFAEGSGTRTGYLTSNTTASPSIVTGQWYHIGFTYAGGSNPSTGAIIYINGVAQSMSYTNSSYTAMSNNNAALKIGQLSGATPLYDFNGNLDEGCFFGYELTQSQISYLYNSGTPQNPMAISGNAPIAYYPLGGSSTGSSSSLTIPNESVPSATVFDFASSFIDCGDSNVFSFTDDSSDLSYTFSSWLYADSLSTDLNQPNTIISKYATSANEWWFLIENKKLVIINYDQSNPKIIGRKYNTDLAINTWYHVAATYNGSKNVSGFKLYLNGIRVDDTDYNSNTTYGGMQNQTTNVYIGKRDRSDRLSYFDGELSNTQIWQAELLSSEITTLYNYGSPLSGTQPQAANLKAWYKMGVDTSGWNIPLGVSDAWQIGDSTSEFSNSFFTNQTSFVNNTNVIPINHASINDISEEITVGMWVKTTYNGAYTNSYFILRDQVGGTARNFNLSKDNWYPGASGQYVTWYVYNASDAALNSDMRTGTTAPDGSPYISIADGNWHHVVGTYASDTINLYIDGVLQNSNTSVGFGNIKTGVTTTILGRNYGAPNQGYNNGYNSNAQIWDKALTAGEVTTLYNLGKPINTLSSIPQSSSLKGWWALDNTATYNSGASTFSIPDKSGNSNDVTGVGMAQSALQPGLVSALNGTSSGMTTANLVNSDLTRSIPYSSYSMNFDGVNNTRIFKTGYNTINGSTSVTVSIWVNKSSANGYAWSFPNASNGSNGFDIRFSGTNALVIQNPNGQKSYNLSSELTAGWTHIVVTYDGSEQILYANGISKGTNAMTGGIVAAANELNIGNFGTFNDPIDADISNLAIWNSVLTNDQILTIYNGGVPNDISSLSPFLWVSLGSDSYYNGEKWICPDLGSSGNNCESTGLATTALLGIGPGSTGNGTATGMNIPANLQGNAPNSTKNAFSINMTADDKTSSVPVISS